MTLYLCGCQDDREPGGWKACDEHKDKRQKEEADEPDSPTS